jgi:integrase
LRELRNGRTGKREYYMDQAFSLIDQPRALKDLSISRYSAHPRGTSQTEQFRGLSVETLRHLSTGAFLTLTGALTARRRSELVDLKEHDITRGDTFSEITFLQRKSAKQGFNKSLSRPLPTILADSLAQYIEMDRELRLRSYSQGEAPLFVSVHGNRVISVKHVICNRLALFSSYLCYKRPTLPEWTLSPHQLRRLFAQMFYWHSPDSNLDALTWFLGHLSPEETAVYLTDASDTLDFTQEEGDFVLQALASTVSGPSRIHIDPKLLHFLRNNKVTVSDIDSLEFHIRKLIERGMVQTERLSFKSGADQPLIAIRFTHNGQ